MADSIIISFYYNNVKHRKNLLPTREVNKEFDNNFDDESLDISVDSKDSNHTQNFILIKFYTTCHFLSIFGKKIEKRSWVKWEIDKVVELNRKLITVKTNQIYTSY
jgi:hypothetical protein